MAVSDTHDVGRFYWHVMHVTWKTPPVQLDGQSYEVEEPWRIGRCVLLRLLFLPYALVLGWWGPPRTLAEMLADEAAEAEELAEAEERVSVSQIREDFRPERDDGDTGWAGWVVR